MLNSLQIKTRQSLKVLIPVHSVNGAIIVTCLYPVNVLDTSSISSGSRGPWPPWPQFFTFRVWKYVPNKTFGPPAPILHLAPHLNPGSATVYLLVLPRISFAKIFLGTGCHHPKHWWSGGGVLGPVIPNDNGDGVLVPIIPNADGGEVPLSQMPMEAGRGGPTFSLQLVQHLLCHHWTAQLLVSAWWDRE